VTAVAGLPLSHIVVIRDGMPGEKPERRRRKCLEQLLYTLDDHDVAEVVLESRGPKDDRRDRDMLDSLRSQRSIRPQLRMDHLPGPKDPLLWVPDATCGAVTHDRTGEGHYLECLRTRVDVTMITLGP
jgi:hypothetical protein